MLGKRVNNMEIKKGRDKLILTEEEAKVLINARELLDDIYQNASEDDELEVYARDAHTELENFLSYVDIDVEVKQKEPTIKVVVVSIDEFEF